MHLQYRIIRQVLALIGARPRAAIGTVLALTLTAGLIGLPSASASTSTFTGSVDSSKNSFRGHLFTVDTPSTVTLTLNWTGTANVDLFLKDPRGTTVAGSSSGRPEIVTFSVTEPGQWKGAVLARSGSTSYTMTVDVESAPTATAASAVKTWTAENENSNHQRTMAQAVDDAQKFDLIVASPNTYVGETDEMKAANGDLVVLGYLNAMFVSPGEATSYPDAWYSKDAQGKKITSTGYGNYLMRPDVWGWVNNRVAACQTLVNETGYDGCSLDMLTSAPLYPSYVSGLPVNPATNRVWTTGEWQAATTKLASKVRAGVPGKTVWGNGFGSGPRYYDGAAPTSQLATSVDGAITESWLRIASMGITEYRSQSQWQDSVDQLVDLGSKGVSTSVMVKLWTTGTKAQKDAYHLFALSTFLLGTDGKSTFHCSYDPDEDRLAHYELWNVPIGDPVGHYTAAGTAFQRSFTGGKVVVNPTDSAVTVWLGGTFVDAATGKSVTKAVLPANAGGIYTR